MPTAIESTGSGNWATGSIWSGGVSRAGDSHDVTIKDGNNVTISQDERVHSITIENNATLTITGTRTLVIVGKDGSSYSLRAISGSTISGTLNVKVEGNGGYIREQGTGSINDLEVDLGSSSEVHYLDLALSLAGNLTITEGIFNTNASSNHALTVTGATTIGPNSGAADQATLTCNASTVSLGASETSSYALRITQGGTFTGGSGTHTIGSLEVVNNAAAKCTLTSGVTTISSERTSANEAIKIAGSSAGFDDGNGTVKFTTPASTTLQLNTKPLYNVIIDHASCVLKWIDNVTIAKDLNIYQGTFEADDGDETLTVSEDVTVGDGTGSANTAVLGHADDTAAMTFGSLTIASDGKYIATSGTTTITDIESGASRSVLNSGTLTHNSGTFLFNGAMDQKVSTNSTGRFNNITLNKSNNDFVFIDSSTTVEGNLDITMGDNTRQCRPSSTSGTITVLGNVIVREGIMLRAANDCSGNMEFGGLILESGGIYGTTSGTTKINGVLRNIGGTIN